MSNPLSPREIERWYPSRWDQIAGNSALVRAWGNFLVHGGGNFLVTGPSRTGKTRGNSLGIMAVMCPHRDERLNPCGRCGSCSSLRNGGDSLFGIFSAVNDCRHNYVLVDCENVTAAQLREVIQITGCDDAVAIVYLDEVAALSRRELEGMLLKPIDESTTIWIGSAITVRRRDRKGRARRTTGLSAPLENRFPLKVGTSLPQADELTTWIRDRCQEWEIRIDPDPRTIPLLIQRCRHHVGFVLHVLSKAASRGRFLGFDDVEGHDFRAE